MINVKERIMALLKANNVSQYELARKAGLSKNTINGIFTQKGEPKLETIEKIASAFGLTLSTFFDEAYKPHYSKLDSDFLKLSTKSQNIIIYLINELE